MNRTTIAVIALVAAAACEGKKAPAGDSATTVPQGTAALPAVRIVSPADGDTTGADVTVVLGKENVTIAKADGSQVEGIGHYHLFLDTAPSPDGEPIPPNTATTIHIGTGDSTYTFTGLSAGPHELIAVIGYGNHVPMSAARDTVRFVVKR